MSPHVIRLRGPWQYQPLSRTVLLDNGSTCQQERDLPAGGTVQLPADWSTHLGQDYCGRVRYMRRFGKPTGLAQTDRVQLVFARVDAWAAVSMNDRSLGIVPAAARDTCFDVSDRLLHRNRLVVDVEWLGPTSGPPAPARADRAGPAGGLVDEVRLEIFS